MKTLYFDCHMGAAGDMLTAALLELVDDKAGFVDKLNNIGLENVHFAAEIVDKCGIQGTHMSITVGGVEEESMDVHAENSYVHAEEHHHNHVHAENSYVHAEDHYHDHVHAENDYAHAEHTHEHTHEHVHHHDHDEHHDHSHAHDNHDHSHEGHDHHHDHDHDHTHTHHHSGMHEIEHIVSHLQISDKVKKDVMNVYNLIAEAEGHVHGKPVDQIHFHEVGTMDAIADVTAVCMLMEEIAPDRIVASEVHVGSGQVKCAHGILPVPAPATAYLLRGIPSYGGAVRGELCTPTGAALLKYFVQEYGSQPSMAIDKIGYGCGKKNFEQANVVRAVVGFSPDQKGLIKELACNLDDCTAEEIGFAMEELLAAGALDVYTTPISMKKNRPGIILTCMCREADREKMLELMFKHTTTLGIREYTCDRYTLNRKMESFETTLGTVHRKTVSGWGTERSKLEYEDLAKLARENNISIREVKAIVEQEIE